MKRVAAALLAGLVVVALAAGLWAWQVYQEVLSQPLIAVDGGSERLQVERGTSLAALARKLVARGFLERAWPLRVYARYTGDAAQIQAGEYRIMAGMTAPALLAAMVRGDVVRYELTIIEGWRFRELLAAIRAHDAVKQTLADADPQAIMTSLGHPEVHPEGRFLPETYQFTRGTTDRALLQRAYRAMERVLDKAWAGRAENLPLETPAQALTLASIVEKETAVPEERARIAGVFTRRLRRGMRLQTDPTVIYGLGEDFDGNLRRRHLREDTPYNTYTRAGLPPTPIALPSRASVQAALHPAPGDALYFVATGDGRHVFSDTLAAHNRAVHRYQLGGQDE